MGCPFNKCEGSSRDGESVLDGEMAERGVTEVHTGGGAESTSPFSSFILGKESAMRTLKLIEQKYKILSQFLSF